MFYIIVFSIYFVTALSVNDDWFQKGSLPKCPSTTSKYTDSLQRDYWRCQTGCARGGCPQGWTQFDRSKNGINAMSCVFVTNEYCERRIGAAHSDQYEQKDGYNIEWELVMSCNEQASGSHFVYGFAGHNDIKTINDVRNLLPSVLAVKIVPAGETPTISTSGFGGGHQTYENKKYTTFAVQTKACSNHILALNRGKEVSYQTNANNYITGYSNMNDWYGSDAAKMRLKNSCKAYGITYSRDFQQYLYQACGNGNGIHISPALGKCSWDWDQITGNNIDIYFGFDATRSRTCGNGNAEIGLFDRFDFYEVIGMHVVTSSLITGLIILCFICVVNSRYNCGKKGYNKVKSIYNDDDEENV